MLQQLSMRFFPILLLPLLLCLSCEVETEFVTGPEVSLSFSQDTLSFDTVFTARGSATRQIRIYNELDRPVMIDRISVEGMTGVNFTFNADGFPGPEARDVVIWGNDSIFVFVEAEVDPTQDTETSPFIAEDRLIIETGEAREEIVLQAFGQNAFYPNGFNANGLFGISCDGGTAVLPQELPTVIYGAAFITDCVVQALPGTRIYVHGGVQRNLEQVGGNGIFNAGIIRTEADGSLQLLGTREEPVLVATDRLEPEFSTAPAKYRGLWFGAGSQNNIIQHARIRNAIIGVQVDSAASLDISDTEIAYTGGPAVQARLAEVTIRNGLMHSNFGFALQLVYGGTYTIEHTTVANYGVDASGLVLLNFDPNCEGDDCLVFPLNTTIKNSVFAGSRPSELILVDGTLGAEPGAFNVSIDNSVVRTDEDFLTARDGLLSDFYETICSGCYNLRPGDPLFRSIEEDDYRPDSLGVGRNLGVFLPELPTDLAGTPRDTERPDAGALEFVPE